MAHNERRDHRITVHHVAMKSIESVTARLEMITDAEEIGVTRCGAECRRLIGKSARTYIRRRKPNE